MTPFRIKYQTYEFDGIDIHLKTLRDRQVDSENEEQLEEYGISFSTWSQSGIVLPASKVLAQYMLDYDIENKRILEVGCGMALTSHLLNSKKADISATDYKEEVKSFLEENTKLNNLNEIPFAKTDANADCSKLGKFDLIIGSDIFHDRWHTEKLTTFINNHANEKCEIIISDPGSENHIRFSKIMESHGFSFMQFKPKKTEQYLSGAFKGQLIKYIR